MQRVRDNDPFITCNSCFLSSQLAHNNTFVILTFSMFISSHCCHCKTVTRPVMDWTYNKIYIYLQKLTRFSNVKLHFKREQSCSWQKHHEKRQRHQTHPFSLYFLSASRWLSPGFHLKMPHENIRWFQLASRLLEQRNESAELMKLRAELCKYCRKEFANICSNEGSELTSTAPTSRNVSLRSPGALAQMNCCLKEYSGKVS